MSYETGGRRCMGVYESQPENVSNTNVYENGKLAEIAAQVGVAPSRLKDRPRSDG